MSKAEVLGSHLRPAAVEIDPAQIPNDMKLVKRWLCWRWVLRNGKWQKPPDGSTSTDSSSWKTFDEAYARLQAGEVDGIGFALGDGWAGVDLDDCRIDGELTPLAAAIIKQLDTYTEVSPSGTGVKLMLRGAKPAKKCKSKAGDVEIYDRGRYFTITSQRIHGDAVENRQAELEAVYAQHIAPPTGNQALDAMCQIQPGDTENDGSRRLYAICCRAVEHNLSDAEALASVRSYELRYPFPREWSDEEVLQRVRDAEQQVKRGDVTRKTTDIGNAERFADQHGNDVRHVGEWAKWLTWDGTSWAVDNSGEVVQRAKRTARHIATEAADTYDPEYRKQLTKWAHASESNKAISACLSLAKSEVPIAVDSLDAQPWLLNCEDGTIDLRTGELREHRREDYLTKCAPVKWSTSEPTLWLTFLDKIFAKNKELIGFIQRLMGLSLVGEVREHVLPIFHGTGANGKSVLVSTWLGILGDYATKAPPGLLLSSSRSHPTELAALHGRRLVAASETDESIRLSEATVKDLTGGEPITARRMREDFWQFTPSHTFVLSTNHKPAIVGTDNGVWRRVLLVPFDVTIPADEQDQELTTKLKAEWPAILAWAVRGCLDWQRDGLKPPKDVQKATKSYRTESDTIAEFIDECCKVANGDEVKASELYAHYRYWSAGRGEQALTSTMFGLRMSERYEKKKSGVHYYQGLKLK